MDAAVPGRVGEPTRPGTALYVGGPDASRW